MFSWAQRTPAREMDGTSHLELAGPIVIRMDGPGDETALRRLAELDSRTLPEGSLLLAEVRGELGRSCSARRRL